MTANGLLTRIRRLFVVFEAKRRFPYRSVFIRDLRRENRRSMARINKRHTRVVYKGR